jgi:hypothetical protein
LIRNITTTTFAMLLILTFAISIIVMPVANAQSTRVTYAYIGATPNPVGRGQETLLHVGITQQLNRATDQWKGLSVTITKPDGTTETLSGINTDSTGGTGVVYRPAMTGNYTLQTHFPGQVSATTGTNVTYKASDSEKLTLIVTEEPVAIYPGIPLPDFFWTRPINAQFREWYSISGNWLTAGSSIGAQVIGNDDAAEAPHILWTKPLTMGGLVGGEYGLMGSGATSVAFENGDAYEGKWANRLIIGGRLYYIDGAYDRPRYYHCVDLRTGEEYWSKVFLNNATVAFGQLMYWESYNYQGTFAYLWVTSTSGGVTTWTGFDAFTGEYMCNITNVPSGTRVTGSKGEIYLYSISQTGGYMTLWNQSALVSMAGSWGSAIQTRTLNASATSSNGSLTAAAKRAWAWNITIPKGLRGSVREVRLGDRVVGSNLNNTDVDIWAFSLKPGQEGQLLFNNNWKAPAEWLAGNQSLSWSTTSLDSNVGVVWSKETRQNYGFSLQTGQYLWVTEPQHYLDIYDQMSKIYYDRLYSTGVGGIIYCYNLTTGKTLWTYAVEDPYTEILWGNNWHQDIYFPSAGRIYFFHNMHSDNQPLPRGAAAFCLNSTTGEVVWRVDGLFRDTHWGSEAIIGDSVIAMYNTYDQQVYAIGKGPSATTVSAGPKTSVFGDSIIIEGTVMDISPGLSDTSIKLRFPNGVPAVSDESMGEWMKYVYAQFPLPANVKGVEVTLSVLDANNNYREIGKATADSDGYYGFQWTPDIEGKYTVYASFTGSKSLYPSHAVTSFGVDPVPTIEPVEEPVAPPDMTDTYVIGIGVAIIIAIAIVGAVIVMLFKKRA